MAHVEQFPLLIANNLLWEMISWFVAEMNMLVLSLVASLDIYPRQLKTSKDYSTDTYDKYL